MAVSRNDMNIKQAKQEIIYTVKAYLQKNEQGDYLIPTVRQRPVLLIGAPGIGKTQIMEQIARECRIGLVAYTITHHTRQSAVGLPFIQKESFGGREYSVTEYTMSEIIASVYRKIRESGLREGILFIDEINCVSETLAPTMLQFLQCKTFGNQAVPQGWIIVAAGNPPEYNKSVRDFDMVTLDRVRRMDVEADYTVWKEYARQQHLNSALLSYLDLRPQNFYRVQSDVDGIQFVTARGWEDLSNLIEVYERLALPIDEEVIREFLQHTEVAKDVSAYLDLYRKYQNDYGIREILEGRTEPEMYQRIQRASFDERLSVVNLLLSGLHQIFRRVAEIKSAADLWYVFLKEYRRRQQEKGGDYVQIYETLYQQELEKYQREKKSGFYTRMEQQVRERVLEGIKKWTPNTSDDTKESFMQVKEGLDQCSGELIQTENEAMKMLEHAFDFMEEVFSSGQEMVVFVTELAMGTESAAFLTENTCERYLQYNRELLIGSRKAELISRLQEDQIRGQEHSREF